MSAVRWQVSTDNVTWLREVFPTNAIKTRIRKVKPKLDDGQIFTRKELNVALEFGGTRGQDDWNYFKAIERNQTQRCTPIYIRKQKKCGGSYSTAWLGRFSTGSGFFDFDNCVFKVKPETFDKYTCWLEKEDVKTNILLAAQQHAQANIVIDVEFGYTYTWHASTGTGPVLHATELGMVDGNNSGVNGWGVGLGGITVGTLTQTWDGGPPPAPIVAMVGTGELAGQEGTALAISIMQDFVDDWVATNGPFDGTQIEFIVTVYRHIWWRQRFTTPCEFGAPVTPVGSGWVLITDNCGVDNTALWGRPPAFAYTFGGLYHGTAGPTPPVSPPCDSWVQVGDFAFNADPMYVCYSYTDANVTQLDRSRLLVDAILVLIDATGCGLTGIRSDFFDWDPVGNAPNYLAGENYVTRTRGILGAPSETNALLIIHKSDALNPTASNPATLGEMTIKEMFRTLCMMFEVFYDIDDAGYVRVEHWIHWTTPIGLDLHGRPDTIEPRAYQHLSDRIPRIERLKFMEAQGPDFVGKDIIYSGPCVQTKDDESVREYSAGRITTDIAFIFSDPDAISKEGFVILATNLVSGTYITIISNGPITSSLITNGPLATANLEAAFWTFRRYLKTGNMNGVDVVFDDIRTNVEQAGISTTMCCEALVFDMGHGVDSRLGDLLGGIAGVIEEAELDLYAETLTLTLRYAY